MHPRWPHRWVAANTARSYLDALEQTYMVRRLQPWLENLGKRVVKSPKIYFRDSGLFHALQGIGTHGVLQTHPKLGASWEGFALEQVIAAWSIHDAWFHTVHSGSELDLLFLQEGKRVGVEFKRVDAPRLTKAMQIVRADPRLDELRVVYPGDRTYQMADGIAAIPLKEAVKASSLPSGPS